MSRCKCSWTDWAPSRVSCTSSGYLFNDIAKLQPALQPLPGQDQRDPQAQGGSPHPQEGKPVQTSAPRGLLPQRQVPQPGEEFQRPQTLGTSLLTTRTNAWRTSRRTWGSRLPGSMMRTCNCKPYCSNSGRRTTCSGRASKRSWTSWSRPRPSSPRTRNCTSKSSRRSTRSESWFRTKRYSTRWSWKGRKKLRSWCRMRGPSRCSTKPCCGSRCRTPRTRWWSRCRTW